MVPLACMCKDSAAEINKLPPQTILRYGHVYHYQTPQTICGDHVYSGISSERIHRIEDLQNTSILSQSDSSYLLQPPTSPPPPPLAPPVPVPTQLPPPPDIPTSSGSHNVNRMPITVNLLRTVVLQPISESPKKFKISIGIAKPKPVVENECSSEASSSTVTDNLTAAVQELSLMANEKYTS